MSVGSIAGASLSVKVSTDPRDLNQDGKVTAAEIQAYAQAHPDPNKATDAQTTTPVPGSAGAGTPSLLDVTV